MYYNRDVKRQYGKENHSSMNFIIYRLVTYITFVLESSMALTSLHFILTPRYSLSKCLPVTILAASIENLICCIDLNNIYLRQIMHFVIALTVARILYNNTWKSTCFAITSVFLLAAFTELLLSLPSYIFFPDYATLDDVRFIMLFNFLFLALYILVLYLFLLLWKKRKGEFLPVSLHITFLLPLSQFLLMAGAHYILAEKSFDRPLVRFSNYFIILGTILLIPADIQLYRVIRANSEKERLAAQLEVMKQQAQRELEYYDSVNEKILETRKIRHDFQNQLQTAYQVFLSGSADSREQAVRLLHQLKLRIDEAAPSYFCPNMIVNAVLAEKSRKAKLENIAFETDVQLPADISIEEVDLCSVFANLLDNAIQAAAKAPNEKTVSVRSWVRAGYCIVKVTNSLGQGAEDLPENTRRRKKESSIHGYGLLILDSIAKRYHGELTTNKSSTLFDVTIQLRLQEIPRTDCA